MSSPGGFHTQMLAPKTCHLQQGRTNPGYLIVLRKTYPSEGKKRLQGYARLSGLWVIATAGSITKGASLY
jgi:ribosomal protein L30E